MRKRYRGDIEVEGRGGTERVEAESWI